MFQEGELINQILKVFDVSLLDIAFISGIVYFLTESLKVKFPKFKGKEKTQLLALGLSVLVSYSVLSNGWQIPPDWVSVVVTAAACWLLPDGYAKKLAKRKLTINNTENKAGFETGKK